MTTKEQERKALAKIREIIDGLGENSYIATAFAGCLEDASENIENDFACSMKDRFENAEKTVERVTKERDEARELLKIETEKREKLAARTLDKSDTESLLKIVREKLKNAIEREKNASAEIVEHCENPKSQEFEQAREMLRAAKADRENAEKLVEKLTKSLYQ